MTFRLFLDSNYNSDDLKKLASELLGMPSSIMRKGERIDYIAARLLDPVELKKLWGQLDELSQKAVTAAYHNNGEYDATAFVAQYDALPERPGRDDYRYRYYTTPILLDMFIWQGQIPSEMLPLLAAFLPAADVFKVEGIADAPQVVRYVYKNWHNEEEQIEEVAVISAETERTGWTDLLSYLRLLERRELKATATGMLNARSVAKGLAVLVEGEFLPQADKPAYKDTIRLFGLSKFINQAGFGWGAGLSKKGRAFLNSRDPELLLEGFEQWAEEGSFDELTRISAISGIKSKKTRLTKPTVRRSPIIEALSWCPTNEWITIDQFYRAIHIWHFDFDVENPGYYKNLGFGTSKPSTRYSAWYSDGDYWLAVKGLLINTIIWEYLATIGAVDVAFIPPEQANFPLQGEYLDGEFYSRYDGLQAFRINALGAYLLGQADEYVSSQLEDGPLFVISADKRLTLTNPTALTPDRRMLLEQLGSAESDTAYILTSAHVLDAVAAGYDFDLIRDFFESHHDGALPDEITQWLTQLEANQKAFKVGGKAVFIDMSKQSHMTLIENDPVLSKLSTRLTNKRVVIAQNRLTRFKARLKALEYLMDE